MKILTISSLTYRYRAGSNLSKSYPSLTRILTKVALLNWLVPNLRRPRNLSWRAQTPLKNLKRSRSLVGPTSMDGSKTGRCKQDFSCTTRDILQNRSLQATESNQAQESTTIPNTLTSVQDWTWLLETWTAWQPHKLHLVQPRDVICQTTWRRQESVIVSTRM